MNDRAPVITGTGIICSSGYGIAEVWKGISGGTCALGPLTLFSSERYGHVPVGEVASDLDSLCGQAARGSRTDKLAYIAVHQALTGAGLAEAGDAARRQAGVVLGTTVGGVLATEHFLEDILHGRNGRYGVLRHHECASATALCAGAFECFGPTTTLSTACSGSAMAIAMAAQLIQAGEADIMIAVGCDSLCRLTVNGFGSLLLLDPDGCRPFDATRAGISLGEGAAALVIESEASADRRGTTVLARLTGWGYSCDAFHATAPDGEGAGARQAMSAALAHAAITPAMIDHINAHGTGTPGNDLAEGKAITRLFGDDRPPVLSTKRFFGHTLGASGAIDAVICVQSIREGGPPMSPGFTVIDPDIGFAPVQQHGKEPQRHIMTNAFGFGGNNVSLILSHPDAVAPAPVTRTCKRTGAPGARFFVTGVGAVAPMGSTIDDIYAACSADGAERSEHEIGAPFPPGRVNAYRCPDDFGAKEEIPAGRRRRLERIQLMTLVAAKRAMPKHTEPEADGHRISVAIGTGLGATAATAAFMEPVLAAPDSAPSPQKFTNAVHNALASQVAIDISAHGLNATTTQRDISFECALHEATQDLAAGNSDVALVGAADELTPYLLAAGQRWGWWDEDAPALKPLTGNLSAPRKAAPGEGAVVFRLSTSETEVPALAEVRGVGCGRYTTDARSHIDADREVAWVAQVLERDGLSIDDVDAVLSGANGEQALDAAYGAVLSAIGKRTRHTVHHGCYKHLCGEYYSASAFGLAVAVGLVAGAVSPTALFLPDGDHRIVLVYTLSPDGARAVTCVCRTGEKR